MGETEMKIQNIVMPVKIGISLSFIRGIPAFAGMVMLLLFSAPALAAPYVFAPENCDFQMSYPEKPFIENRCKDGKNCEEIATFTRTKDAAAINFRVSCRPENAAALKKLKPEDLKRTIQGMAATAGAKPFAEDSARLDGDVLSAVALAIGERNDRELLYTGQIWVGPKSVLTLESEISGPDNTDINTTYTDILKSIMLKSMADKKPAAVAPAKKAP